MWWQWTVYLVLSLIAPASLQLQETVLQHKYCGSQQASQDADDDSRKPNSIQRNWSFSMTFLVFKYIDNCCMSLRYLVELGCLASSCERGKHNCFNEWRRLGIFSWVLCTWNDCLGSKGCLIGGLCFQCVRPKQLRLQYWNHKF